MIDRNRPMSRAPSFRTLRFAIAPLVAVALLTSPTLPVQAAGLPLAVGDTPVPSLAPIVKRVAPAVVNISTQGTIKQSQRSANPLLDDPFFRRFFDQPE